MSSYGINVNDHAVVVGFFHQKVSVSCCVDQPGEICVDYFHKVQIHFIVLVENLSSSRQGNIFLKKFAVSNKEFLKIREEFSYFHNF